MKKAVGGTMMVIAMIVFVGGLIIVACESPTLMGQMRNAAMGFGTMFAGFLIGLAGEKVGTN